MRATILNQRMVTGRVRGYENQCRVRKDIAKVTLEITNGETYLFVQGVKRFAGEAYSPWP
jgi:hypothetical protein